MNLTQRIGRNATSVRVLGASLICVFAIGTGVALAAYSQATNSVEPYDLESIMVASFTAPGPTEDAVVRGARATADVTGFDPSDPGVMRLELRSQLSADQLDGSAVFLLGGAVAGAVSACTGVTVTTFDFEDLDPEHQSSVLAAIESQLLDIQELKDLPADQLTNSAIRHQAHAMDYLQISAPVSSDATWTQDIPDGLRSLPVASNRSSPPVQQQFSGSEAAVFCELDPRIVHTTIWGARLELPSIGVALPDAWKAAAPPPEVESTATAGIAIEAKTTVTSKTTAEMDPLFIAEGASQQSLRTESERGDTIQATGVGAQEPALSDFAESASGRSKVAADVTYLGSHRFSERFTNTFYRTTKEVALFTSGALFGLAATMTLALGKTAMRAIWRAPKS